MLKKLRVVLYHEGANLQDHPAFFHIYLDVSEVADFDLPRTLTPQPTFDPYGEQWHRSRISSNRLTPTSKEDASVKRRQRSCGTRKLEKLALMECSSGGCSGPISECPLSHRGFSRLAERTQSCRSSEEKTREPHCDANFQKGGKGAYPLHLHSKSPYLYL